MPIGKISRERFAKICEERGIKPLAKDHPYHREGVTITFINRSPKRQKKIETSDDREHQ